MKLRADVEVLFEFIGQRKEKLFEGYRPAHLVKKDYLTTGVHSYYDFDENSYDEIVGTITFISPEEYPACMWIGKKIEMYEGTSLIGHATIRKIFNPILEKVKN
jgi:elongation factor Tu